DVGRPGGADGLGPTGLAGFDPLCSGVHTGEEALCETAAIEVAREAAAASACLLSHHLGHARHRLSAPGRPSDAEPRHEVERVGDQDATGRRRRIRDELVAVERAADRALRYDPVFGQILLRQAAALCANVLADAPAQLAAV